MPGILKSISTTSGRWLATSSIACSPSQAWATTSTSSRSSRMATSPARKTGWSSTTSTRIVMAGPVEGLPVRRCRRCHWDVCRGGHLPHAPARPCCAVRLQAEACLVVRSRCRSPRPKLCPYYGARRSSAGSPRCAVPRWPPPQRRLHRQQPPRPRAARPTPLPKWCTVASRIPDPARARRRSGPAGPGSGAQPVYHRPDVSNGLT